MPPKPIIKPLIYPDCSKCKHYKLVEFGLIDCQRSRNKNITPNENCNIRKVNCVFFDKKLKP